MSQLLVDRDLRSQPNRPSYPPSQRCCSCLVCGMPNVSYAEGYPQNSRRAIRIHGPGHCARFSPVRWDLAPVAPSDLQNRPARHLSYFRHRPDVIIMARAAAGERDSAARLATSVLGRIFWWCSAADVSALHSLAGNTFGLGPGAGVGGRGSV